MTLRFLARAVGKNGITINFDGKHGGKSFMFGNTVFDLSNRHKHEDVE